MKRNPKRTIERTRRMIAWSATILVAFSLSDTRASARVEPNRQVLVRDITTVEGVRDNLLVGYGLVTGLRGS